MSSNEPTGAEGAASGDSPPSASRPEPHAAPRVVSLREKLAAIDEHWCPKVVGELNSQHVKLAKLKGEFTWHAHEKEDELFLVLEGRLSIELRGSVLELGPGEMTIIPRGMEHRPVAREEVHVLLFEPVTTVSTGDVREARTVTDPEWA